MSFSDELRQLLGADKVAETPAKLQQVAGDESSLPRVLPAALVWPENVEEIREIVKLAGRHRVPITARGAGSALEGSTIPDARGIVLDLSRLNQILDFWPDDLQVRVQPGVVFDQLNDYLKRASLWFPCAPGGSSDVATIGGMVSTNASGIYSVKYGGTKDYVLESEVVDGQGHLHRLGDRASKRSSGYNLTDLIAGSEGTLAIITSVTLRLRGIPEGTRKFAYSFKTERSAATAVSEMMRYGLDLAGVEFLDRNVIVALNQFGQFGLAESPSLFLEAHGSKAVIDATQEAAEMLAGDLEGLPLTLPSGQNPWEIRHHVTNAIKGRRPGYSIIRNDVDFPISKLPEMVAYCGQLSAETGLLIHAFGHVGMGLLHALTLARKDNPDEWQLALDTNRKIITKGVELGGAISGEHGIGIAHKQMFSALQGESLYLYRQIKRVFDPLGILNPGKVFDLED
jgi:D-lactate dehydrogenase (cytochrome)